MADQHPRSLFKVGGVGYRRRWTGPVASALRASPLCQVGAPSAANRAPITGPATRLDDVEALLEGVPQLLRLDRRLQQKFQWCAGGRVTCWLGTSPSIRVLMPLRHAQVPGALGVVCELGPRTLRRCRSRYAGDLTGARSWVAVSLSYGPTDCLSRHDRHRQDTPQSNYCPVINAENAARRSDPT